MGVTFIATSRRRGNVHIVGPITGIDYLVTPFGTPVSDYDVAELLEETAPPCCGESVPLGGVVRLFGVTSATEAQIMDVPDEVLFAEPKDEPKRTYKRKKKSVDIPVVEAVATPDEEDEPQEEEIKPEEESGNEDIVMEE